MLYSDYTAKSLDLRDAIITNIEQDSDVLHIFLELERATHTCPVCGTLTAHIHDYRTQIIKDLDIRKQQVFLHLRKRRCSCCNKRFQEDNSFLMRYQRMTAQLDILGYERFFLQYYDCLFPKCQSRCRSISHWQATKLGVSADP